MLLLGSAGRASESHAKGSVSEVLGNGQLMRLNFGVFALHLMQTHTRLDLDHPVWVALEDLAELPAIWPRRPKCQPRTRLMPPDR